MFSLAVRPRSPALLPLVKSLHYHESELPDCLERIMPNGQAHLRCRRWLRGLTLFYNTVSTEIGYDALCSCAQRILPGR